MLDMLIGTAEIKRPGNEEVENKSLMVSWEGSPGFPNLGISLESVVEH
jgi:hypothetical protein